MLVDEGVNIGIGGVEKLGLEGDVTVADVFLFPPGEEDIILVGGSIWKLEVFVGMFGWGGILVHYKPRATSCG